MRDFKKKPREVVRYSLLATSIRERLASARRCLKKMRMFVHYFIMSKIASMNK